MHTFFNAIFWRLFLFQMPTKGPIATKKEKTRTAPNRPRPSCHSYSFYMIPPSVSNILTVQIHRNLLHTLLHTFCIKLWSFTIIYTTLAYAQISRQLTRKSRKIKRSSHFQDFQEFHRKAPAYKFDKFLLVCFHCLLTSYIYGLSAVFSFLRNGLPHHFAHFPNSLPTHQISRLYYHKTLNYSTISAIRLVYIANTSTPYFTPTKFDLSAMYPCKSLQYFFTCILSCAFTYTTHKKYIFSTLTSKTLFKTLEELLSLFPNISLVSTIWLVWNCHANQVHINCRT